VGAIERARWRRVFAEMFTLGATSTLGRAAWFELGWLLGPRLDGVPDDPTLVLAQLTAWGSFDAAASARSISCPTLVIGTEHDRVFPPANVRELAERIPSARLVIAPGLAHSWPPDAMADHIAPFLAEAEHGPRGDR
jgi:pimeloyl-ACP methyl ester carboxylesterase